MRDLDETDLEILQLLLSDARRPYSEIADAVGLSPPAVSDRVSRLREVGVVRRFTLDVDRSQLRDGVPVLLDLDLAAGAETAAVRSRLLDAGPVEHAFTTAAGGLVAYARAPDGDVAGWLDGVLGGDAGSPDPTPGPDDHGTRDEGMPPADGSVGGPTEGCTDGSVGGSTEDSTEGGAEAGSTEGDAHGTEGGSTPASTASTASTDGTDLTGAVDDLDVTLLSGAEWSPDLGGATFGLTCAECGNTVDSEGTAARVDGDLYQFCCSSCEARFVDRYERLSEGAG